MEDRREFPRLNTAVDIEYKVLEKEAPQKRKTISKNISAGGICLIVYEKVAIGSILGLKMHLTDIDSVIEARGKVLWSSYFTISADKKDRYDLGIEFTEISKPDRQKLSQYIFSIIK